ncbi:MAG TPA: efflux RND transporter periplasmic adaptor subunit [Polyangiaceae bacterium]|jgi:cobalt-zinc-cadmium efflux system membrane fusion protein
MVRAAFPHGLAVLAVLAAFGTTGCNRSRAAPQASLPPGQVWLSPAEMEHLGVSVAEVKAHGVDDVLVASGRVSFDENRVAHVVSPVSGRVERIDGVLGGHVAKGQILALIRSPDLGDATATLSKATADLIAFQHALERTQALHDEGGSSDAALEQARDAWRIAKTECERAQEKVALLHGGRAVTETYPLTSPIDGAILARNVTPGVEIQGAYAGGSAGELFTVGDVDDVWVYADVYEADLARVHLGQPVDLSVIGIPIVFHGKVDILASMLDPQTRTTRLRTTIPNPEHKLEPEMYGTVRVHVAPIEALSVPKTAILRLGGQQLVFIDRGPAPDGRERFERMPITADEDRDVPFAPVMHGLEKGEKIAVEGAAALNGKL